MKIRGHQRQSHDPRGGTFLGSHRTASTEASGQAWATTTAANSNVALQCANTGREQVSPPSESDIESFIPFGVLLNIAEGGNQKDTSELTTAHSLFNRVLSFQ